MTLQRAKSIEVEINGESDSSNDKNLTFLQRFKIVYSNMTVEPMFFFYLLPSVMASLAMQNLNLEKACRVNLKMNESICDAMTVRNSSNYDESDEIVVQKLIASMYAWKNVVQSILPAILLLFIGSWSDRHNRRKPCIIWPIIGEMCTAIGFLVCTFFFYQLTAEYSVIAEAIPPAITGGWFTMYMGIYSYVSQHSGVETRTVKIGALSTISNVSYTLGMALSGVLLNALGFYGIFSLSVALYLVGLTLAFVKVQDEKPEKCETQHTKVEQVGFLRDFFDIRHFADTFRVAFKSGARDRKKRICVIMILVMVVCGPLNGEYAVYYLFVRYKFQWDEIDFSIYSTFNSIVFTIGTIFSLSFFSKYLKMDDAMLGVISSISKVASGIVYAFAPNSVVFYLGAIVEALNGTSFIAMRSIISKLVSPDELGKINSLFGMCEALMPLVYGPLYSLVYKWTIKVFPGFFFLLGGIMTIPAVLIFLWLYFQHKKDEREAKEENKELKEDLLAKSNGSAVQEAV